MKSFKDVFLVCFTIVCSSFGAFAQMGDEDPIQVLYNSEADHINCKAIQVLLSTYDANLKTVDCSKALYGLDEESFNKKIVYSKTQTIAADINKKKKELGAKLNLDNFESSLRDLLEFSINRSADVGASIDIQTKKAEELRAWGTTRIEGSVVAFDDLLASEGASTSKNNDPLAEDPKSVKKVSKRNANSYDESGDVDWIVWLVVILAVLSILMGLLTLLSMRKSQNEIDSLKKQVDLINAEQSRNSMKATEDFKPEINRLTGRLSEFEDILFQLKKKSEEN